MKKILVGLCALFAVAAIAYATPPSPMPGGFVAAVVVNEGDPNDPNDDTHKVYYYADPGPYYLVLEFHCTPDVADRLIFEEPWTDCPGWPPNCPENHINWIDSDQDGVIDDYVYG